jgi:hypothetical protein
VFKRLAESAVQRCGKAPVPITVGCQLRSLRIDEIFQYDTVTFDTDMAARLMNEFLSAIRIRPNRF